MHHQRTAARFAGFLAIAGLLSPLYVNGAASQSQSQSQNPGQNRGQSQSPAQVATPPRILSGEMRLAKETRIAGQQIVLKDLVLITNGFQLVIDATGDLEVGSPSTIRAFDVNATRQPGEPGRSAGLMVIRARRVIGAPLLIDNSGEDGMSGKPGDTGSPGKPGEKGVPRQFNPISGCYSGSNGSQGGPGGPGGDGGPGGSGGNGGVVLLEVRAGAKAIAAKAVARGGRGGAGGPGGSGGPGGDGGSGADGNAMCGGTALGPQGIKGPTGRDGLPGSNGSEGQILTVPAKPIEAATATKG